MERIFQRRGPGFFLLFLMGMFSPDVYAHVALHSNVNVVVGYYEVKVLEINRDEASVKMHVRMFNPDGGKIYDSVGFGLQLLDNGKLKTSLLAKEVDITSDLNDSDWARKYSGGFVKKVIKEDLEKITGSENPDSGPLPVALITIYCTDQAWIDHLTVGEVWESYAYEVSRYYDECDPILYDAENNEAFDSADLSEFWMPVPSLLFEQDFYKLPNTVYIPKYTKSSYVVDTVIEFSGDYVDMARKYHGQYVMDMDKNQTGILVWSGGHKYACISEANGNRRYYYRERPLSRIGFLLPRKNFDRQVIRTNYTSLFEAARPVVKSVSPDGKRITLEVAGIVDLDDLRLTKSKILKILCYEFVHSYGQDDTEFPLSKLLKYVAKQKTEIDPRGQDYTFMPEDVVADVADGIILDFEVDVPERTLENFDSMDYDALVDYFENDEWPCHVFRIFISDEAFGIQVDKVVHKNIPMTLFSVGGDDRRWDKPILWSDYEPLISN